MAAVMLDIETRVEAAALELLRAISGLTTLVGGAARVRRAFDGTSQAAFPCATVHAVNFIEHGAHSGCYLGILRLSALTYQDVDKAGTQVRSILGWLRGWAQQTDLAAQINDTVTAKATATKLTCVWATCHQALAYENAEIKNVRQWIFEPLLLVRPN